MELNIKKRKKTMDKLLGKKRKALKKIQSKKFSKFVIEEVLKKFRDSLPGIISTTLKEEIVPYINDIDSREKEKSNLDLPIEDYFKNIKQKEKEKMIYIKASVIKEEETDVESVINNKLESEVEEQIEKSIKRKKDQIRIRIKELIRIKLEKRNKRLKYTAEKADA